MTLSLHTTLTDTHVHVLVHLVDHADQVALARIVRRMLELGRLGEVVPGKVDRLARLPSHQRIQQTSPCLRHTVM
jgi:hypothetical protein